MNTASADSDKPVTSTSAHASENTTGYLPENHADSPTAVMSTTEAVVMVLSIVATIAYALTGPAAVLVAFTVTLASIATSSILVPLASISEAQAIDIFRVVTSQALKDALNDANNQMRALLLYYDNISHMFEIWKKTTDEQERKNAREQLRDAYKDLTREGRSKIIGAFSDDLYGGFKLSQFAIIASRYLAALKDFHRYANELDLPAITPLIDIKQATLDQLRKEIAAIVDQAAASYFLVRRQFFDQTTGYKRSWDDFNSYRNTATQTGLDLVSSFAYLDPELYPNGCHLRNLNRRLITFLNTSNTNADIQYRSDIAEVENNLFAYYPIVVLSQLKAWHARVAENGGYTNGLIRTRCTMKTTDGYNAAVYGLESGSPIPSQLSGSHEKTFETPIRRIYGIYEAALFEKTGIELNTCIGEMTMDQHTNGAWHWTHWLFHNRNWLYGNEQKFSKSTPQSKNGSLPAGELRNLTGRLSHILIVRARTERHINYAFYWNHMHAVDELLPESSHRTNTHVIKVEQLHAVRAGKSIHESNSFTVFPTTLLTGGDLVIMSAATAERSKTLNWYIKRDSQRWFAGKYRVRLWYVNQHGADPYDVHIIAENSQAVPSFVSLTVQPGITYSPTANLQFKDLQSHTSAANQVLLITDNMPYIEIKLINGTIGRTLMVDRIELIFSGPASI